MGAMRLSSAPRVRAEATVRAAVAAGVNVVDTADVYGVHDHDRHGNERWLASLLGPDIRIVTKGGLVRGPGRWRPDGRAKALYAACEGSLAALGREAVDLYLLHAPDPRTPLKTSARALGRLLADGRARAVGLSNVGVDQLREVESEVPVAAVQVALSPYDGAAIRSGIVEHCLRRGIRIFAHSPFGGPQRAARLLRDPVLKRMARDREVEPHAIALAWLRDLGVVPLPGPTRPEHTSAIGLAMEIELTPDERRALDERFPLGAWLRAPRARRRPRDDAPGEVVLLMGIPAAGKTTAAAALVDKGYVRFNRDEIGGTLAKLHRSLDTHLEATRGPVVLDNTYPTRALRHEVIERAWAHGRPVRCVWLDTPLEAAQVNAVHRIWDHFGRLPGPQELKAVAKEHPNLFGPEAQSRFGQRFEPPHPEEGFVAVERRPFVPRPGLRGEAGTFVGDSLRGSDRVESILRRRPGPVVVLAWWPGLDDDAVDRRRSQLEAEWSRPVTVLACTHPPTAQCWCLLPRPGLAVSAVRSVGLEPARSLWIGRGAVHRRSAQAAGVPYVDVEDHPVRSGRDVNNP